MKIEILGTGCAKCNTLAANAKAAAETLGVPHELVKVTDLREIMKRGVMLTPGLAIDGKVVSSGKLLDVAAITTLLADAMS